MFDFAILAKRYTTTSEQAGISLFNHRKNMVQLLQ
jgi:hypothetical protein